MRPGFCTPSSRNFLGKDLWSRETGRQQPSSPNLQPFTGWAARPCALCPGTFPLQQNWCGGIWGFALASAPRNILQKHKLQCTASRCGWFKWDFVASTVWTRECL